MPASLSDILHSDAGSVTVRCHPSNFFSVGTCCYFCGHARLRLFGKVVLVSRKSDCALTYFVFASLRCVRLCRFAGHAPGSPFSAPRLCEQDDQQQVCALADVRARGRHARFRMGLACGVQTRISASERRKDCGCQAPAKRFLRRSHFDEWLHTCSPTCSIQPHACVPHACR
eukprot:6002480-Pleurochrysis_carterae.AAC.2